MNDRLLTMDAAIVGGGLAGLTAAAYLAKAGLRVVLFEKAHALGGRATTEIKQEFYFNLGPHALFQHGEAVQILRELGVPFSGRRPGASGGYAILHGEKHTLPGGLVSLLTTSLFGLAGKLETAKLLGAIQKFDARAVDDLSVAQWLEREIQQPTVRDLVQALFRVASYANDPARQSAGAALAQLQMAFGGGVLYVDGGWQTLVDGLRKVAEEAGAQIVTSARVAAIEHDQQVRGVRLETGEFYPAASVVVAAGPTAAASLLAHPEQTPLPTWAQTALPIRAACLDLALKSLPQTHVTFALGIDQPLYFSVHSAAAKLAPAGGVLLHVAKYLPTGVDSDPKAILELEALTDLLQPGWRAQVVHRRFLPGLLVSHGLTTAAQGGLKGRPGPVVPGVAGLYVAGDWVGPAGSLTDVSAASARQAAELIIGARRELSAAA